jgi:toxin ParE1/3/4
MAEVTWTDNALQDIDDIAAYIAKDSMRYAEITALELFEASDILEQFPRAGSIVPEMDDESIRQLVRGSYRIIYQIKDETQVVILTVHHSARLFPH